ncbi:MAG: fumarate hydratase [Alphaproteobacteria bacterium]|nr:fumarate hydratase [Alphaproteobacteria bacterium]
MFHLAPDRTPYSRIDGDYVSLDRFRGKEILTVSAAGLTKLAAIGFRDMAFLLRPGHLEQLAKILEDSEASDNDRFVALDLLKNAVIAAGGVLPMCQDTGTAIIIGHKGQQVWCDGTDEDALVAGIKQTYAEQNLRYSQLSPVSMFSEVNTGSNLPAQIDIFADAGDEYHFLMLAKGGGSANKTYFYQQTPAVLNAAKLLPFLDAQMRSIGTSACPPYHLAVVIGGLSAEMTLKTVKLASTRYLDGLPTAGGRDGAAFRDLDMEAQLLDLSRKNGIGAQFGGKYFCHDVRVIRLPRHGASMPIGIGVSCSADRQILGKITRDGLFIEQLETDPARFLPPVTEEQLGGNVIEIDINQPMREIRRILSQHPVKTRLSLSGKLIVARDLAHAKIRERLEQGEGLPEYFRERVIYYAGPAKTPAGYASGSFGPTTAGRMDGFIDQFMAAGGSFVTLAKGNRSQAVTDSCQKHGGFYLGSIGGPGARLAQDAIKSVKVLEYPELGMEAVWEIEVENFPAFVVVDDKGHDFFAGLI